MPSNQFIQRILILLGVSLVLAACAPSGPTGPVIFAASSLQAPLDELAENWTSLGNREPVLSYASSTALARQIENGSLADLYISADEQWIDYIVTAGKIDPDGIRTLAGNSIVLATSRDGPHAKLYETIPTTAAILEGVTVTSGDPDSVPLGRYAKEILVAEGIWDDIGRRMIRTSSSSAALRLVLLKEADFGVLYASDVERRDDLVSYPAFAKGLHSPIRYKAVLLPSSGHPEAGEFLDYIASDEAAAVFAKYGFTLP
ncbi:molybdate ABC transporter substrate-binding protein [Pontixanthobacter aestiaquae]|uniref:Molybdate ABC transporter substrate-binding protein n=1 Tax=Pontixanthobacter aestiaquae TaxID=1509367 RepID=A0A844Z9R5_9SPHN|nr:molybdate ABC transporter substrate-binding protein [Pontixanthobacter aestiaquae]MDN3644739.1 molybdate ABC transporter substrate-binding protein [Pontixanthobacter aestiaquae]MXO84254.1 molybdate ABC transporter substrate-binding protein [Pontixanthobacter aestiaquae]